MRNKNSKAKFTVSSFDDEQRLRDLLRQHKRISEEIIALVMKTTAEADDLIHILERQTKELPIGYPRIQ